MKSRILSALAVAAALATAACEPAFTWREPISMASYSPDAYVASNMLTVRQRRIALPEGWSFRHRKPEDPEGLFFWIHDTGGNAVIGAYSYRHFDMQLFPPRATEIYASTAMKDFSEREGHKSELDGTEAHVITGVREDRGARRITALIYDGFAGKSDLSEITFIGDKGFLTQNPTVPFTIFSTYKIMPRQLSERRFKGSFSFKCDDGSVEWMDDVTGKWQKKGFNVYSQLGQDGLIVSVRQVETTRFADYLKMDMFQSKEIETELHFAGKTFPARAVIRNSRERSLVSMVFLFKHEGKDYILDVFRGYKRHPGTDINDLHEDPEIRPVLDKWFYFDG